MIDLDNQLAAYARYLDDSEASLVVLHPKRLEPPVRAGRRHRRIALAAACVITLGGAIAVGTTRFGGRDGVSGTVAPGEWVLVDDPDGVFVPPPGGASVGDEQQRTTSENAIWVHSVEPIGDGFLAVGDEMQGVARSVRSGVRQTASHGNASLTTTRLARSVSPRTQVRAGHRWKTSLRGTDASSLPGV